MDTLSNMDDLNLFDISIKEMNLTDDEVSILSAMGVESVGDCVDYHVHKTYATTSAPLEYHKIMDEKVADRLKALGLWKIVEENISNASNA